MSAATQAMECPACSEHPALEPAAGESAETRPVVLLRCPGCDGVWANATTVTSNWERVRPPAAEGEPARRRLHCHACGKLLPLDETCRTCGAPREPLACPRCHRTMTRRAIDGVSIDICESKDGLWFDAGEMWSFVQAQRGKAVVGDIYDRRRGPGDELPVPGGEFGFWLVMHIGAEILFGFLFPSNR